MPLLNVAEPETSTEDSRETPLVELFAERVAQGDLIALLAEIDLGQFGDKMEATHTLLHVLRRRRYPGTLRRLADTILRSKASL